MPKPDEICHVAVEWVKKAENDLTNASHTLKLGEKCPTDTVVSMFSSVWRNI